MPFDALVLGKFEGTSKGTATAIAVVAFLGFNPATSFLINQILSSIIMLVIIAHYSLINLDFPLNF